MRRAGSKGTLSIFEQVSRIGLSANDHWSRSWSPWLDQNRLKWNILLVCASKGIAFALSNSSRQTKEKTPWMRFGGSHLRYLQRRAARSRDWTEKRLLH